MTEHICDTPPTYEGTTQEDYQHAIDSLDSDIADISGMGDKLWIAGVVQHIAICDKLESVMAKYYPSHHFKVRMHSGLKKDECDTLADAIHLVAESFLKLNKEKSKK